MAGKTIVIACLTTLLLPTLSGCTSFQDLSRQPMPYIEPGYGNRVFPGDENTRLGQAQFIAGNYGLSEQAYRRAVEVTPQNGQAWLGLAASYDRLGRYDLADGAYRQARRFNGDRVALLNNEGYSQMLRGNNRQARILLSRANRLDPGNPTIINNLAVLDAGQAYFAGVSP